jgi:hypothetical protein
MALKVTPDGVYVIKTEEDAKKALRMFEARKAEILELREESGLDELDKEAISLKAAVRDWMIDKGTDKLIFEDGKHATVVRQHYGARWIGDEDDIDPDVKKLAGERELIPLRTIIEKKFESSIKEKGTKARRIWRKITKTVIDHEAMQELVSEGVFSVDEVSPAFVEQEKAPYLRIFEDAE